MIGALEGMVRKIWGPAASIPTGDFTGTVESRPYGGADMTVNRLVWSLSLDCPNRSDGGLRR